jgi:3-phosphoshikimate 1-carboxyvinyltransferase
MPVAPLPIPRLSGRVERTWPVPGSKSITNRALLLAALSEGTSVIDNVLASDDTRHMRTCLAAMGVDIRDGARDQLIVVGGRSRLRAPAAPLFVGNSGTTVRFCAALAALIPGATTFVGDEHMAKRPIADLVDGLRQLGVRVDCATGCPPITVHGGTLPGGRITMRGDRSSQYFTALLLVAGFAESELEIAIEGSLVSVPYVEMTRRMVADFGGRIDVLGGVGDRFVAGTSTGFRATRLAGYRARGYRVEPDASSASYPFALAAAGGHRITVRGLDATSLQGDYGFVRLLAACGVLVTSQGGDTTVEGSVGLDGINADMHHISDTVMTLAAIAPLSKGATTISNVANIRIKETDRLLATFTELRRLGQQVEHGDDWLRITPRPLQPAEVQCYADHRMAMSFAVLGACAGGVVITDPACTAKTYPGFWHDLAACYPAGACPVPA